jgi:hypothetical protein
MPLRIGAFQNCCLQLGHLFAAQRRRLARTMTRFQALDPLRVIPVHPVAQGLAIHPGLRRSLLPGLAIQHRREREQAADLGTIKGFRCYRAKIFSRVVDPCDGERLAHSILLWPESGLEDIESNSRTDSQPRESQPFRRLVLAPKFYRLDKNRKQWSDDNENDGKEPNTCPIADARPHRRLRTHRHGWLNRGCRRRDNSHDW